MTEIVFIFQIIARKTITSLSSHLPAGRSRISVNKISMKWWSKALQSVILISAGILGLETGE